MEKRKKTLPKGKAHQWHPAFYAGVQIELKDDAENLTFENEHQLGTKPFGIDVLIVKKKADARVQKNIGRIFRKHNIMEYKSPTDYLSIDDFYKTYGYTFFYKADVETNDSIQIDELSISLVCQKKPKKLLKHFIEKRGFQITKVEPGIYYVIGDVLPIQILVTIELSYKENLWLRSLTNQLGDTEEAKLLLDAYKGNEKNKLHESVMDIVVQANQAVFQEVKSAMCNALKELMRDEIEQEGRARWQAGRREGRQEGRQEEKTAIIHNLLKRSVPDSEICSIVECDQALVDEVKKTM